jgi:hypothetical protein
LGRICPQLESDPVKFAVSGSREILFGGECANMAH